MPVYNYEYRTRQYDSKIALWAWMDDPTLTPEEHAEAYVYPDRSVPMMKCSVRRWVCVYVGHDKEDVDAYLHDVVGFDNGKLH